MRRSSLRHWQSLALERWREGGHRGIVSVVTGGGKTIFALACVDYLKPRSTLIVVPTAALLDQWWEEVASYFDYGLDEVNIVSGRGRIKLGAINIAVLNTAASLADRWVTEPCFLIVDECHKAASEKFRSVLSVPSNASLGLSATPERQYDDGLRDVLIPSLGNVIFNYDYRDALRDGVIVPFRLNNIIFDLEDDVQSEYDKITRAIARSINRYGAEAEETVSLYLRRARVLNLSSNRIRLAIRLVALNKGRKILIFHEDVNACEVINGVLKENGIRCGVYHSRMNLRDRADILVAYRSGQIEVLVTCRALDEGFNVPETEIGIIAASTATRRQRIQRLGRVVRPANGKESAVIYTLIASGPEISRLKDEEEFLDGVASVSWEHARKLFLRETVRRKMFSG